MKRHLVLYDFDGTITSKDTFLEFIKFYRGTTTFYIGMILNMHWLVALKVGLLPNWKAKEYVIKHFFKGEKIETFNEKGELFCNLILPKLVRQNALKDIENHKNSGADVFVVSASAENWVKPWCDEHDVTLIATRLETLKGEITGNLDGYNCYGPEKVNRIKKHVKLEDYDSITAYGDSAGDKEMLSLAHSKFYRFY